MKVRQVLALLRADGWAVVAIRGSHRQLKHPVKRGRVTLRAYPGRGSAIVAFQVMRAQARWSSARWFSGFFDQRIR
ncbi:MAG: type II toxin-antitoxin system HicA family toxin, partial [Gaiellaceae bacterium]